LEVRRGSVTEVTSHTGDIWPDISHATDLAWVSRAPEGTRARAAAPPGVGRRRLGMTRLRPDRSRDGRVKAFETVPWNLCLSRSPRLRLPSTSSSRPSCLRAGALPALRLSSRGLPDRDRGRHRFVHRSEHLARPLPVPSPGPPTRSLGLTRPSRAMISRFPSPEGGAPHEPVARRLSSYRPAMRKSRGPRHPRAVIRQRRIVDGRFPEATSPEGEATKPGSGFTLRRSRTGSTASNGRAALAPRVLHPRGGATS
jgi:hypothetical protein